MMEIESPKALAGSGSWSPSAAPSLLVTLDGLVPQPPTEAAASPPRRKPTLHFSSPPETSPSSVSAGRGATSRSGGTTPMASRKSISHQSRTGSSSVSIGSHSIRGGQRAPSISPRNFTTPNETAMASLARRKSKLTPSKTSALPLTNADPRGSIMINWSGVGSNSPSLSGKKTPSPTTSPQSRLSVQMSPLNNSMLSRSQVSSIGSLGGGGGGGEGSASGGSKRIGFGQRYALREKEKQISERAKARYLKLMAFHHQQAAIALISSWYDKYKVVKAARRELKHRRNMKQVFNFYIMRWMVRWQRRKARTQELLDWGREHGKARVASAMKLQLWWRHKLARVILLRACVARRETLVVKRNLEMLHYRASLIQSMWRRHLVRKIHQLRLHVMKRRRAVLIVRTIRTHYAFKQALVVQKAVVARDQWAATVIARAYRVHLVSSASKQFEFRREKELLLLDSNLREG